MNIDAIPLSSLPAGVIDKAHQALMRGERPGSLRCAIIDVGAPLRSTKVELTFVWCVPNAATSAPFWAAVGARQLTS